MQVLNLTRKTIQTYMWTVPGGWYVMSFLKSRVHPMLFLNTVSSQWSTNINWRSHPISNDITINVYKMLTRNIQIYLKILLMPAVESSCGLCLVYTLQMSLKQFGRPIKTLNIRNEKYSDTGTFRQNPTPTWTWGKKLANFTAVVTKCSWKSSKDKLLGLC